MNGFIRYTVISAVVLSLLSCTSQPIEDDLSLEGASYTDTAALEEAAGGSDGLVEDEFSDFAESAPSEQSTETSEAADQDLALEQEFAEADIGQEAPPPAVMDEELDDPFAEPQIAEEVPPPAPEPIPEPIIEEPMELAQPEPEMAPVEPPMEVPTPAPSVAPVRITDLQFKANDQGGTVVVRADQPLTYSVRSNPDLRQYIVEVDNAILPDRLKRSLNTKDIQGAIGAIDAYQNPGSTTARFVIQLREGAGEPLVQPEGNSLLIVSGSTSTPSAGTMATAEVSGEETVGYDTVNDKILSSSTLAEYLAGNTKFYGKKVSIETNNMDIRDALNFITEESGVNMVIAEEVRGTISLKLRQVPWDQALVMIMRAKKLGYTRQGNVLRIAPIQDLKAEEDDATKLALARKTVEPLRVRMFPISYAKVDELEKKIKDFLGERGKVVGDVRTNALVVTDIEENLDRVAKLILSLDTQPPQVLIEGKIVEATEQFTRTVGVSWGASGAPKQIGTGARGPVNMTPSFSVNPGAASGGNFNFALSVGTLDIFGNLTAALALSEQDSLVKVISSPRIMTLSNEPASINQTTEVPVRQVTITGNSQQTTVQFKPLALKLDVTPQVTADGSVIMKVGVMRQFQGADVSADASEAIPVNSREANTRVLVKNGQTAVIGGIYQSDATNGTQGVPWFKDLPVLGYLFKRDSERKQKLELMIFLTPRIMAQQSAGAGPTGQDL